MCVFVRNETAREIDVTRTGNKTMCARFRMANRKEYYACMMFQNQSNKCVGGDRISLEFAVYRYTECIDQIFETNII